MSLVALAQADVAAATVTTSPNLDVLSPIVSTGVVGAVLLMILFRVKLVTTGEHEAVIKEKDSQIADRDRQLAEKQAEILGLRAQVNDLSSAYQEKVIPALTRVYDLVPVEEGQRGRRRIASDE